MQFTDGTRARISRIWWNDDFQAFQYTVEFRNYDGDIFHWFSFYNEVPDIPAERVLTFAAEQVFK